MIILVVGPLRPLPPPPPGLWSLDSLGVFYKMRFFLKNPFLLVARSLHNYLYHTLMHITVLGIEINLNQTLGFRHYIYILNI